MEWLFLFAGFVAAAWWFSNRKPASNGGVVHPEVDVGRSLADAVPARFVVFDLETTGLYANQHEIIEIGAIRVDRDGDRHDTFQTLIRSLKPVPVLIEELTGISEEMLDRDGVPLEQAMRDLAEFVGDLPMVAFNAKFDKSFLSEASRMTGVRFKNKISCALIAARRAWPGRQSYKLVDLSRDGGLNTDDSHRALGDCHRALVVYVAACRAI